ncbi:MAG: hypothetical protein Q9226_006253 [Calogaya cf. arnoldii]
MPPRHKKTTYEDPPKQSSSTKSTKKKTFTAAAAAAASSSKTPPLQRKRNASKPLKIANTRLRLICKKPQAEEEEQEEEQAANTSTAEEQAAARGLQQISKEALQTQPQDVSVWVDQTNIGRSRPPNQTSTESLYGSFKEFRSGLPSSKDDLPRSGLGRYRYMTETCVDNMGSQLYQRATKDGTLLDRRSNLASDDFPESQDLVNPVSQSKPPSQPPSHPQAKISRPPQQTTKSSPRIQKTKTPSKSQKSKGKRKKKLVSLFTSGSDITGSIEKEGAPEEGNPEEAEEDTQKAKTPLRTPKPTGK